MSTAVEAIAAKAAGPEVLECPWTNAAAGMTGRPCTMQRYCKQEGRRRTDRRAPHHDFEKL